MNNIWSENKYIDITVNILLFLVGINFMHYGQLFLPVICFILFLDHKLVFKVNQPMIFVLLCLFAVSFYAFSYRMGFYSVMAFVCPMAYYIGSNIRYPDNENVKKVLCLLAVAMGMHLFLDFARDLVLRGIGKVIHSSSHYDIWTNSKISSTAIAMELDLLIGIHYYLLVHEKDKIRKYLCIALFLIGMVYCLFLARRAQLFMLFVSMFCSALSDRSISLKQKKEIFKILMIAFIIVLAVILLYVFDLFGLQSAMDNFYIFEKLSRGLADSRIGIYMKAIPLLPKYPWGGQAISEKIGLPIHELWLDIYDYAGLIPYLLFVSYTFFYLKSYYSAYVSVKEDGLKTMLAGLFVCILIQMFLEPVMTGSSIFLIVAILIGTITERMNIYE